MMLYYVLYLPILMSNKETEIRSILISYFYFCRENGIIIRSLKKSRLLCRFAPRNDKQSVLRHCEATEGGRGNLNELNGHFE